VSYSEPADATHPVVHVGRHVWDVRNIPSRRMSMAVSTSYMSALYAKISGLLGIGFGTGSEPDCTSPLTTDLDQILVLEAGFDR
jgi:hypothetical protein